MYAPPRLSFKQPSWLASPMFAFCLLAASLLGTSFQPAQAQSSPTPAHFAVLDSISGGNNGIATVMLSSPAPPAGTVVSLSSSSAALVVPPTLKVFSGTNNNYFIFTTTAVKAPTSVTIKASCGGTTLAATVTVMPLTAPTGLTATAGGSSVSLSWNAVPGIGRYGLYRALSSGGPYTEITYGVCSNSTTDALLTNGTTYYYVVTAFTDTVEGPKSSEASATPVAPPVASVSLSPASVTGGLSVTGTVTLTAPDETNGTTVNLLSNTAAATVPATVTVPARVTSATFTVSTSSVVSASTATISAKTSGVPQTATLTVNPVIASLGVPTNLTATPGSGNISLSWTQVQAAAKYNIYRGTTSGGPYRFVGSSPNPIYTDAPVAVGVFYYYTVTSANSSGGEGGSSSTASTVVLAGSVSPDVPAPGWAEDMIPTDEADGEGFGPSSSNSVNLASGVAENHPGADLMVYNPVGPSATYERLYRSALADSGYGSPGLSAGWSDNYDLTMRAGGGGTYILRYPNGALETLSPGQPNGTLTPPVGAPYLVSSTPGVFKMTFTDHSTFTFSLNPNHSGSGVYWMSRMTNPVGHGVTISRDGSDRLTAITNDASPATALLSFAYDTTLGTLLSVTGLSSAGDTQPRQVNYWFGQAADYSITKPVLLKVSRLNTPTSANVRPLWQYDYFAGGANSQPYLQVVSVADPAYPDVSGSSISAQSSSYINYNGSVVTSQSDANGNGRVYRYGSGMAHVQALAPGLYYYSSPVLVQQWLQLSDPTKRNVDTGENDANNHRSAVTYNSTPSNYLPDGVTNRNTQKTTIGYDPSPYANVSAVTDPRNTTTSLTYNAGQVQSAQTGGLAASSYDYYPNGLINHVYTPQPEMQGGTNTTTYVYDTGGDNLGNVISVTSPGPNGNTTVSYGYKAGYNGYTQAAAVGEPVAVTVTGPDALGGTTATTTYYKYDTRGNQIAVIDALGNETDSQYNLADQSTTVIYPAVTYYASVPPYHACTTYTYAYVGGPLMNLNVSGRTTDYVYGHEGELLQVKDSPEGVQYTYDGRYRVTGVIDDRNFATTGQPQTNYTYDAVGNLAGVAYPNRHTTADAFDRMAYSYDADNNLVTRVDGNGVETDYILDPLDSLLRTVHYPGGQLPDVSFGYDGYGRRLSMTDQTGAKSYTYDDLDNLLTQTTSFTNGPQNQTFNYHFLPNGSRKQMVTPLGAFNYQYDGLGRMSQAKFPWPDVSSANAAYNYTYYANGWLQQAQGPSTVTNYAYDGRGFLTDLKNTLTNGSILIDFNSIKYDELGNRGYEQINFWGSDPTSYIGYSYSDPSKAPYNNGRSLIDEGSSWVNNGDPTSYDAAGNPVSGHRLQNGNTYNSDNQVVSNGVAGNVYQFDGNGNPLRFHGGSLAFDVENRLTKVSSGFLPSNTPDPRLGLAAAGYDGDDLRAWKTPTYTGTPTTYFLYDGSTPVLEEIANGSVVAANGWGADGWRQRYGPAAGFAFSYTFDPQGNLSQRLRYGGLFGTSIYDGFGQREYAYYSSQYNAYYDDPVGFGGQYGYYTDPETGLALLTHRYYDFGNGRFLTRDPIGYEGGLNLYSLGLYNPINNQDPSGFNPLSDAAGVVGLVPGPVGMAANLVSAGASLYEGDYVGAGLSILGEVPALGELATGAKIARAVNRALKAKKAANEAKTFITYVIRNEEKEVVYVGKARGIGTPNQVLTERLGKGKGPFGHDHYFPDKGDKAEVIATQGNEDASAGAEDVHYEAYKLQGAQLRNKYRPLSMKPERLQRTREKINAYAQDLRNH